MFKTIGVFILGIFSVFYAQDKIEQALNTFNIPGAVVGVVVDGEIVFAKGYGFRDQRLPMTEKSVFGIGSCTKAFTAFVLGQLVDEQLVKWDDRVVQYIPEFRLWDDLATQNATIRDLLAHRTGCAGHNFLVFNSSLSRKELIERLQYLELVDTFRNKYHYSNLMYAVAGHLIERVTGKTWEEVVKEKIFDPLHMESAQFTSLSEDYAENYFYLANEGVFSPCPKHKTTFVAPANGINASLLDMLKWIQLQLSDGAVSGQCIINKKTFREMHSPQIGVSEPMLPPVSIEHYGLGWRIGSYGNKEIVTHSGTRDGFQTQIILIPSKKIGVIVATNCTIIAGMPLIREKYFISAVSNMILDELLNNKPVDWIAQFAKMYVHKKASNKWMNSKQNRLVCSNLSQYVGTYVHPGYGTLQISGESRLVATYGDIHSLLCYQGADKFHGEEYAFSGVLFAFKRNMFHEVHELYVSLEPSLQPIMFVRE